jgi:hypothetical protein
MRLKGAALPLQVPLLPTEASHRMATMDMDILDLLEDQHLTQTDWGQLPYTGHPQPALLVPHLESGHLSLWACGQRT